MHRLSPKERAFAIKFMQVDLQTLDWSLLDGTKSSWYSMMTRCYNANSDRSKGYINSGIEVCERWHEFPLFMMDMGPRPKGMSLDRINPYWSYHWLNCRWADKTTQTRNRRCARTVLWDGQEFMQVDLAKHLGVSESTISRKVARGEIRVV